MCDALLILADLVLRSFHDLIVRVFIFCRCGCSRGTHVCSRRTRWLELPQYSGKVQNNFTLLFFFCDINPAF